MSEVNLPPLPPTGGKTPGRSIVDVVNKQHQELLGLIAKMESEPDNPKVKSVLVAVASRHLCAEEQYLYPAIRTAVPGGDELADRELAEDQTLLHLLSGDDMDATVAAIRRHVAADAEELLPMLSQMVPSEDLVRLGNRLETAEEAAPTRPHPATPSTPPWNKVVDPLIGVVDKALDAVTGRKTYVRDL
ncbi:hemerythrin domain-containing protein [Actinoplanes sp. CA-015351]|uniref:hemerythrin domain-containing protein n=1 Tax=Actinoplanes sp. CA-015351 TaxID=3239897 RepID=UPI003D98E752